MIKELREELKELEQRKEELENNENEEEYNQMLDEVGINTKIYAPSRILKKLDPIAYNCGHNDYNDGMLCDIEQEIEDKKQEIDVNAGLGR